jgi:hypothetical protein
LTTYNPEPCVEDPGCGEQAKRAVAQQWYLCQHETKLMYRKTQSLFDVYTALILLLLIID